MNAHFARRALSDSGPCKFSLDILLHQSGHIMLSDFDLAKQSNDPSGMPTMVHSEHNGVSWCIRLELWFLVPNYGTFHRFLWWIR